MSSFVLPKGRKPSLSSIQSTALQEQMDRDGRLPPVRLIIKPLDNRQSIVIEDFLSYQFSSSIMVPVDTFSFTFAAPDD